MSSMKYFVLEHDRRLPANGVNLAFPERMLKGYGCAGPQEIVYTKPGNLLSASSLIEHPILLVSEELQATVTKQLPDIPYKSVVVMDLEQQGQFYYAWMDFPEIPCLAPDRTETENGRIDTLWVDTEALKETAIFQIPYYRSRVLVARVDIAESLLRKSLYGLSVRPIRLTRGEKT